jgi:hypothetical protein
MNNQIEKSQRLYDALKTISQFDSPERVMAGSEAMGLDPSEALEMAYDNVLAEAKSAIRGIRRPK